MRVKWEARFKLNEEDRNPVYIGSYKERDVRALVRKEYPELADKDIYVSGAFESIPGVRLFLGTHAINSSLDLGWPYSVGGNAFYKLLSPDLESLRKTIKDKSGTLEAEQAKTDILQRLQAAGIGLADMIDFCEARDSSDGSIDFEKPVNWNPDLPDLIRNADVVYLNGKSKKRGAFKFLRDYCKRCKTARMEIRGDYIYVGDHRTRLVCLYSSGNVREQFKSQRSKQWGRLARELFGEGN